MDREAHSVIPVVATVILIGENAIISERSQLLREHAKMANLTDAATPEARAQNFENSQTQTPLLFANNRFTHMSDYRNSISGYISSLSEKTDFDFALRVVPIEYFNPSGEPVRYVILLCFVPLFKGVEYSTVSEIIPNRRVSTEVKSNIDVQVNDIASPDEVTTTVKDSDLQKESKKLKKGKGKKRKKNDVKTESNYPNEADAVIQVTEGQEMINNGLVDGYTLTSDQIAKVNEALTSISGFSQFPSAIEPLTSIYSKISPVEASVLQEALMQSFSPENNSYVLYNSIFEDMFDVSKRAAIAKATTVDKLSTSDNLNDVYSEALSVVKEYVDKSDAYNKKDSNANKNNASDITVKKVSRPYMNVISHQSNPKDKL